MNGRCTLLAAFVCAIAVCACQPGMRGAVTSPASEFDAARAWLTAAVDSVLSGPVLAQTHVGIAVASLGDTALLVDRNADRLFVPASNAKLPVALAALEMLGPGATFETGVWLDTAARDTVVSGNLYLVAGGAPDLNDGDLRALARRLAAIGVRRVDGDLVLDATLFDSTAFGPGWMWDEGPYAYNPPVSPFMLNRNTVSITVRPGPEAGAAPVVSLEPPDAGVSAQIEAVTTPEAGLRELRIERSAETVIVAGHIGPGASPITRIRTVHDPVAYAGSVFRSSLADAGISVVGVTRFGALPDSGAVRLAGVRSAPVDVLVRRFLKESDNLVGEALVKHLGVAGSGGGTWSQGLSAVRRSLGRVACLDSNRYRLADGSGLSRYSLFSPRQMVEVISAAACRFDVGPELLSALPIGGEDGSLARRLRDSHSTVRAKTGTMSGVSCLSGVVRAENGRLLAFSIMMNGYTGSSRPYRRAQDRIVGLLRQWAGPWSGECGQPRLWTCP